MRYTYTVWYHFVNRDGSITKAHSQVQGVDVLTALEEFQAQCGRFRIMPVVEAIRR